MIEVRHLRLLRALLQHRTLTRAASALALSQSALSRQLLELEDALGRPLFLRSHRAMLPTEAGRELTVLAGALLAELDAAETRVRQAPEEPPPLRVATECYTCYRWLPGVLRELRLAHPRHRVAISVEATRDPTAALLRGALDLAIVSTARRDRRLAVRAAFDDELVLVTSPEHALARRAHVEARDLAGETLFTYDAPFAETLISRRVFAPARIRPARVHPVPFTEAIVELVASGLGVAALAKWAVAAPVAAGRLAQTRITRGGLRRNWQILHHRRAGGEVRALAALVSKALQRDAVREAGVMQ